MFPSQERYVEEKRSGSGVQQYEWLATWLYERESGGQESWSGCRLRYWIELWYDGKSAQRQGPIAIPTSFHALQILVMQRAQHGWRLGWVYVQGARSGPRRASGRASLQLALGESELTIDDRIHLCLNAGRRGLRDRGNDVPLHEPHYQARRG